jgi:hypothetical protein
MTYIVTAHRWDWLNAPMYHVWAGEDRAKAEEIASAEVIGRGDKYGCQVIECIETPEDMEFQRVAYFPSAYNEKAPYYSAYIDMHESLGRLVRDAVLRGNISIPDPDNPQVAKSVRVETPQWLVDEVRRRMDVAKVEDEAGWNGKQATELCSARLTRL